MTRKCRRARPSVVALAPIALILPALLGVAAAGCGGSTRVATQRSASSPVRSGFGMGATTSPSHATHARGFLEEDGDKDGDEGPGSPNPGQDDKYLLATYGSRPAPPATARAVAAVVKSYYAASLAGDGAHACSLLSTSAHTGLTAQQSAPGNCAQAISSLVAQQHSHLLAEEPASMTVFGVYTNGNLGLALLGFERSPETDLVLEREAGAWRIASLLDSLVP